MRQSQYLESYLQCTANGTLYTPGTYIAYHVRGRAKRYADVYLRSLERGLKQVGAVPVRSIRGGVAYIPRPEVSC